MANKISLEFTEQQLQSLISLIGTVESLIGCSDGEKESDFDRDTNKELKSIERMFKSNGYDIINK